VRQVPNRLAELDARRRWAGARAPLWFGLGVLIMAIALAGTGLVVLAMLGRLVSLLVDRPLRELPVWGWAGWVAAGFAGLGLLVVMASVALSVLRHGADRVLRDVGAVRLDGPTASPVAPDGRPVTADATGTGGAGGASDDPSTTRLRNVVEALSLGLGVTGPRLAIVDDPATNALSVRGWNDETLVVTSGLLGLSRDEIEAVAAHELAHLHARDGRWVTAAAASLGRVRGVAHLLELFGAGLLLLFYAGVEAGEFWGTPLLGGIVIGGIALATDLRVRKAQDRVRAESDEIADVAAVLLARNPAALASVCGRLAQHPRRVARTSWRADHLWFAPLPEPAKSEPGAKGSPGRRRARRSTSASPWWRRSAVVTIEPAEVDPASARRVAEVLTARATAAYQAAGLPVPPIAPSPEPNQSLPG
jgi:Zn-dependent protease with chaperone function